MRTSSRHARVSVVLLVAATMVAHRVSAEPGRCAGAPLAQVTVECPSGCDEPEVRRLAKLGPGDVVCAGDLQDVRRRLERTRAYREIEVVQSADDGGRELRIRLARWPVVASLELAGNSSLSTDELRRFVRLPDGTMLEPGVLAKVRDAIVARYHEEAFPDVAVDVSLAELPGGEVAVRFQIQEGAPLLLRQIRFEGALPVAAEELADEADLRVGGRFRPDKVREAEKRLAALLRRTRYYEATVAPTWTTAEGGVALTFEIAPGPRFELRFRGNKVMSDDDLIEIGNIEERVVVTNGTWRDLARRAQRGYEEKGYFDATVKVARIASVRSTPPLKRVTIEIDEGHRYTVRKVSVEGNESISSDKLLRPLDTRPPSWVPWRNGALVREVLDADLERIDDAYSRNGFREARASLAEIQRDDEDGRLDVRISVAEGARMRVRGIAIDGLAGTDVTAPKLSSREGKGLDLDRVEADRREILSALRTAGYFDAAVDAQFDDEARGDVDLTFVVHPGRRQVVGDIIVQGNVDTKAIVILRELTAVEGDVLTPQAQAAAQRAVYQLNLFRSVVVRPVEEVTDGGRRDVVIEVKERPAGSLQWGLGYNTRDGFHGFGQVGYANLQGLNRRLSLRGEVNVRPNDPQPDQYLGDLGFVEPRLLGSRWSLRTNWIGERRARDVDQYSVQRLALVPAVERLWFEHVRVGLEWIVEGADVFHVDSAVAAEPGFDDERKLLTVSAGPLLVRDARDDSFAPTTGTFETLVVKVAPAFLGSTVPFAKVVGHHSQYVPLWWGLNFAYSLRAGWATAIDRHEQVPIRERFFLGGRTTVRGFSENEIGPRAGVTATSNGSPLGGDLSLNSNVELTAPLVFGLRGVVFSDAGAVYLQDREISLDEVRESAGLGVRYNTPVGALALEYGFKLDRRSGESLGEIHFSVGATF